MTNFSTSELVIIKQKYLHFDNNYWSMSDNESNDGVTTPNSIEARTERDNNRKRYGKNECDVFEALRDIACNALKEADDKVQRILTFYGIL